MTPGTTAGDTLAEHVGFRTNKAATRIKCLGADCGTIMDIDTAGGRRPVAESSHETFVTHLMEQLRPISDLQDPLADPPF